jgi:DNA-cytosine methyltransferase
MEKVRNILSLFDGISGGQIALNNLGISYENYYASEVDKTPIMVTQHNYPNTIQLGDCNEWRDWNIDYSTIDILFAGFPCQSWSVAGNQKGASDPRGKLMFVMMDIFNHIREKNPDVIFLFENVRMKKEFQTFVDNIIGCGSVFINSVLLSAQNRNRQYWSNINFPLPDDKNVLLSEILDNNYIDGIKIEFVDNTYSFSANNGKMIRLKDHNKPYTIYESRTLFGRQERARIRKETGKDTTPRKKEHKEYIPLLSDKANCLLTSLNNLDYILDNNKYYRTFNIKELCKLQTLPVNYFDNLNLTKNQIRKMIGNGWTIDVISHILSYIKKGF